MSKGKQLRDLMASDGMVLAPGEVHPVIAAVSLLCIAVGAL